MHLAGWLIFLAQKTLVLCDKWGWYRFGRALVCLLTEPKWFVRMLAQYFVGTSRKSSFLECNPLEINENTPAILFLHGNYHNPAAFLDLTAYLREKEITSLFTVSLPSGAVTHADISIVTEKLQEISSLYAEKSWSFRYILVAHSRGAEVAIHFLEDPNLLQIISLGTPISTRFAPKRRELLFEIDGTQDLLVAERSTAPMRASFPLGHIGLLYCRDVFAQIHRWICLKSMS